MNGKRTLASVWVAIVVLALLAGPAAGQEPEPAQPQDVTDFNGDWYADLAIGVPREDIDDVANAGVVNILYGGGRGLSTQNNRTWSQNDTDMVGTAEANDEFGTCLAVGDFDGDGFFDLAVGIPDQDLGSDPVIYNAGAVHILYGSARGLTAVSNRLWNQDSTYIEDTAETWDSFGYALAAGDFDGDGYDDLAVGVFYEGVGSPDIVGAGAVNVLYGSAAGLTAADDQLWHQDVTGVEGGAETDDHFGAALTAGDFNGDGRADLAVGVPGEDVGSTENAGAVNILYGSASGLTATGDQIWDQNATGVEETANAEDWFGWALTAGDFDGDGHADLAVGVALEDVEGAANAGAVNVLYGSDAGLVAAGDQLWHQNITGVEGGAEAGDYFGDMLTAGDFDGDGRADLAVGVPGEDKGSVDDSGAVNVLYGSATGLTAAGDDIWDQDVSGISDVAETGDMFGVALAAGDFDGDSYADLVIGVPYEDLTMVDAGMVHVLPGSPIGLVPPGTDDQFWHQDIPDVADVVEANDRFGYALAAIPRTTQRLYLPHILR